MNSHSAPTEAVPRIQFRSETRARESLSAAAPIAGARPTCSRSAGAHAVTPGWTVSSFRAVLGTLSLCTVLMFALSAGAQTVDRLPSASEPERLDKSPEKAQYAIELMVLHATNSGGGIDERVGEMPELKKPPFSAYDTYKLLAKTRLPLAMNAPQTYRLPNSRILKTELKEKPAKDTFKLSASINQPGGKAFLPLLQVRAGLGQSFIVAGQTYKAGILVLVLKIVAG